MSSTVSQLSSMHSGFHLCFSIVARKERYETTYVKVNQELVKKHRELSHLHQEFDWLRVECKKLKAQSQLITGEQERQSQNIDNLIQLIIGEDLSEVR